MEFTLLAKYQEQLALAESDESSKGMPMIGFRFNGKQRSKSLKWIASNPVEAIAKYHLEHMFDLDPATCEHCVKALSERFDGKARKPKFQKGTSYQMPATELNRLMARTGTPTKAAAPAKAAKKK